MEISLFHIHSDFIFDDEYKKNLKQDIDDRKFVNEHFLMQEIA